VTLTKRATHILQFVFRAVVHGAVGGGGGGSIVYLAPSSTEAEAEAEEQPVAEAAAEQVRPMCAPLAGRALTGASALSAHPLS
jgi:hypothetical protein